MLHLEGVLHLPLIGQLQREKLIRGHWPVSLLELPLGQSLGAEWSKLKETRWKYAVWSGRRQWANTSGSGSATEAVLGLLFIRDKTPTIQSILNTRRLAYITRKYITSRSSNDFIRAPAPPPPALFHCPSFKSASLSVLASLSPTSVGLPPGLRLCYWLSQAYVIHRRGGCERWLGFRTRGGCELCLQVTVSCWGCCA